MSISVHISLIVVGM